MPVKKEDFFYIAGGNYDDIAELSLPHYREGHAIIGQILREGYRHATTALDLGTGSGVTAETVLRSVPGAQVTCVDAFEEMLGLAKRSLAGSTERVSFAQADALNYVERCDRSFDVITSAFCLHHLDANEKQRLFAALINILAPGGVFLMLDHMRLKHPLLGHIGRRATEHFLRAHVADEAICQQWLHHWTHINTPDSADDMVSWLARSGLSAEVVSRWMEVGLIAASIAEEDTPHGQPRARTPD